MKFTDGMWMTKDGFTVETPGEIYEVAADAEGLTLYCPYVAVQHRGNTLDGGLLTVRMTAGRRNTIAVHLMNHRGAFDAMPRFPLSRGTEKPETGREQGFWFLRSGDLEARVIAGKDWRIEYRFRGRLLTSTGPKGMAHILDRRTGETYLRERLELAVGENIYGLGERFGPFVKNGQSIDLWNADGGTDSEQAYKNVPFFLSSRRYGVFVNSTGCVSYEIGSEAASKTQFSVPGESMEYFVCAGETPKDVLTAYTALTGRAPELPAWSYGLWLSTSFTTDYDEKTVLSFVDGMIERKIPLSVFHFDCFWMKAFEWSSFLWDRDVFPDPEGLLARLHARGLKVCVWINPYIAQKSPLFEEGLRSGYFVKTGDGGVWQWDRWQAGMALVDFTNPAAAAWFREKLAALVDMGVDCFKTDFGERIPTSDPFYGPKAAKFGIRWFDGSDPEGMHNYYTYLYNKTVFDLLEQKKGKGEACLFARSATACSQTLPLHWGGDCLSTYPSMAESLRGGLSLALSGFAYWSHDIGGFESGCTPDIYMRWTAFGLLSSHSRYHGNQEYKVPWLYGEEAVRVTRAFCELKQRLVPYLLRLGREAAETGVPVMRPMLLEFPDDPACLTLDRQYMLGEALLVAPVMSEDGEVSYYLPAGRWTHLLSGETRQGPGWFCDTCGYETLPLYLREGCSVFDEA